MKGYKIQKTNKQKKVKCFLIGKNKQTNIPPPKKNQTNHQTFKTKEMLILQNL